MPCNTLSDDVAFRLVAAIEHRQKQVWVDQSCSNRRIDRNLLLTISGMIGKYGFYSTTYVDQTNGDHRIRSSLNGMPRELLLCTFQKR
eukprot:jgi/Psemu1/307956/fgenesh1_kg.367_\